MFRSGLWLILACLCCEAASAAVLEVGPGQAFAKPSDAIAKAHDGDTVRVAAGEYVDCATIRQNRFTI